MGREYNNLEQCLEASDVASLFRFVAKRVLKVNLKFFYYNKSPFDPCYSNYITFIC